MIGPRHVSPPSSKRRIKVIPLTTAPHHWHAHRGVKPVQTFWTKWNSVWPPIWFPWKEVLCETQLIQLLEELAHNTSQGRQTDLILFDFFKAFDRVNHMKLLHKLHQHGARGNTLSWIKAFLTGRSQTVVLEGESLSEIPVSSGVPPRFCAWTFVVLLYINDLPENIHSQVRLFADDTAIYNTINNHSDSDTLQQELDTLQTWERLWDMDFNPSKCQVLHISKSRHPAQHIYMALEAMDHAKS